MEQMQMNMPDIYDAALYLRLSKDDMEEDRSKVWEKFTVGDPDIRPAIGYPEDRGHDPES